jgi:LmbE family N-acetylglucosaminyl deacetylase
MSPTYDGAMTQPQPPALEPVREDWNTALAIVAHPDDLEYGAAAAVARWTAQGKRVSYALITSGEAGIDALAPEKCGPLREQEERASARAVGVEDVEFLGFPDGMLEYGLPLRRAIARAVRRHRPDVVITGNFRPTFGPGVLNQADHIATGQAVLDGVRDAANRWIFRELLEEGLEPWAGCRAVLASGSPDARHAVDTTDHLAAGVASLKEHQAYLTGLNQPDFDVEEFLEGFARQVGTGLGTRYAAAFEVFSFRDF